MFGSPVGIFVWCGRGSKQNVLFTCCGLRALIPLPIPVLKDHDRLSKTAVGSEGAGRPSLRTLSTDIRTSASEYYKPKRDVGTTFDILISDSDFVYFGIQRHITTLYGTSTFSDSFNE